MTAVEPDEEDRAPRRPDHLSPSAATTFQQCPARWRFRYVDRLPDPSGVPALVGTFSHRVLELLLGEPPARRTIDVAKTIARAVWPKIAAFPDFQALELDEKQQRAFRWQAWTAIEGLWRLEDPAAVDVVATEQRVDVTVAGVPFVGIVDRLSRTEHGDLSVDDYKSGSPPRKRWEDDKLDQVLLYAAAVGEATGERATRAQLLYLGSKRIACGASDEKVDGAVKRLARVWAELTAAVEADEFEAKAGPLCGWCPFVDRCATGAAEVLRRQATGEGRRSPALEQLEAMGLRERTAFVELARSA